MSYTAPDLADDVEGLLRESGYVFVEEENGTEWRWSFSEYHSNLYDHYNEAVFGALEDLLNRFIDLKRAAAFAVGIWENGSNHHTFVLSMTGLRDNLDAAIPTGVAEYIEARVA